MLNWILSILVHKGVLKETEAEVLAKELPNRIHPAGFQDAHKIIGEILDDVKDKLRK